MTFWTPQRLEMLERESIEWEGTPFIQHCAKKGVGVSCHHLVAEILFACGVPRIEVPNGSARWGHTPSTRSILEDGFDGVAVLFPLTGLEPDQVQPGDVLGFKVGNKIHHVGLMLGGGNFIHTLRGAGTQVGAFCGHKLTSRWVKTWRVDGWE